MVVQFNGDVFWGGVGQFGANVKVSLAPPPTILRHSASARRDTIY